MQIRIGNFKNDSCVRFLLLKKTSPKKKSADFFFNSIKVIHISTNCRLKLKWCGFCSYFELCIILLIWHFLSKMQSVNISDIAAEIKKPNRLLFLQQYFFSFLWSNIHYASIFYLRQKQWNLSKLYVLYVNPYFIRINLFVFCVEKMCQISVCTEFSTRSTRLNCCFWAMLLINLDEYLCKLLASDCFLLAIIRSVSMIILHHAKVISPSLFCWKINREFLPANQPQ